MPRAGIDFQLALAALDGRGAAQPLLAFHLGFEHVPEGGVPSKLLYRVAPGGKYLAYRDWKRRVLHLRDARGAETAIDRVQRFRFSPDGRYLAVAVGVRNGPAELDLLDLSASPPSPRKLGDSKQLSDLEWMAGGVVLLEQVGEKDQLSYLPLAGEPRVLATSTEITAFATASHGSRVLYFGGPYNRPAAPYWVDAAAPLVPHRLGPAADPYNLELSPDGKHALYSTVAHVFYADLDGGGQPRPIGEALRAHSVWFSDDGSRYLWASRERMVLHEDGRDWKFPPLAARGAKAESARFLADGSALVLVTTPRAETVYRWDPSKGAPEVLYTSSDPHDADVDLFDGRLVRLTARNHIHFEPTHRP